MRTEKEIHGKQKTVDSTIIAGPCSAESYTQLLETARALMAGGNVDYFRAGLWKPRTLPGSFEGVGAEGLEWLKMVREETGLKVATEVGSEKHVTEALKYDIDLLWIGARTVSNPFVVQEIAESLRGVDIPVLVKNPLNPDVTLWYGAINRLVKVGLKSVGAIHRGFSIWGKSIYRNPPIWEIPRMLKERIPGITIINDPSHISGKRSLVNLISEKAIKEGADGLMIEVHPDPSSALSDSAQQLTPEAFHKMMETLNIRKENVSANEVISVDELDSEIDRVDDLLIHTIADRMNLSRQIAKTASSSKNSNGIAAKWEQTLNRLLGIATEDGLRPDFIHKLFNEIEKESLLVNSSSAGWIDK